MERTNILQKLIDKKRGKVYLEIGIRNGKNFFKIMKFDPLIMFESYELFNTITSSTGDFDIN